VIGLQILWSKYLFTTVQRATLLTETLMVKLGLYIKAELDGVTNLTPVDTTTDPYFYTFKVVCNSCHEINDNWITISRQVSSIVFHLGQL
jgi:Eukaryotic protein of unknown function (DUF866)